MGSVLHLQAIFQRAPCCLLLFELVERRHCSSLPLPAMLQILCRKPLLIARLLRGQLVGLPPPGKPCADHGPEHQGQQRKPRFQAHQFSTCSARL
ncbi:hypothetical protein CLJ08_21905 [Pseudomonas mosselii]|nr:hypothetical protein CLJ08_21905 [Pseudomonas mosselii]